MLLGVRSFDLNLNKNMGITIFKKLLLSQFMTLYLH